MGVAHNGEDDIAYFAADVGYTYALDVTTTLVQTSDAEGAIVPGRYLIQAVSVAPASALVWVHFGLFEQGVPLAGLTAAPGKMRIPLSVGAIIAFETNILKGYNDRLAAIMTAGTAKLYATLVSRHA